MSDLFKPWVVKQRPLRFYIGVALFQSAVMGGALAVGVAFSPDPVVPDPIPTEARIIAVHDCWVGEAPQGMVPEHAVVTRKGRTDLVDAEVGFDIWLGPDGESGTGDEASGTLHAFCP